jgi:hypothetical protein
MASAVKKGREHGLVASLDVADVQAGYTILLGQPGRAITVTSAKVTAVGTADTATGILLQDTAAAPVVVGEFLTAGLVSATELIAKKGLATFTAGVGWQAPLTGGEGLQIIADGTIGTSTSFLFVIHYVTKP